MNGYDSVLIDTTTVVRGERRAPETIVTNSARFDGLGNVFFVGHIALPTSPLFHVKVYRDAEREAWQAE